MHVWSHFRWCRTHQDASFYQASLPKWVWDLAIDVIDLFESTKLKGQKLNLSNILAKPEFKQQYLAPIRGLDECDQISLLRKVISKEFSLAEMKTAAVELKQLATIKMAFVRLTNTETWEQAEERYPLFTSEVQLCRFIHVDLNTMIPQSFNDFCNKRSFPKDSQKVLPLTFHVQHGSCSAHVVNCKVNELSGHTIWRVYSSFHGAHLTITSFREVSVWLCCR